MWIFWQNVTFIRHSFKPFFSPSAHFSLMSNEHQSVDSETAASNLTFSRKVESLCVSEIWSCARVCVRRNSVWVGWIEFSQVPRACTVIATLKVHLQNSRLQVVPASPMISSALVIPLVPRFFPSALAVIHARPRNPSARLSGSITAMKAGNAPQNCVLQSHRTVCESVCVCVCVCASRAI